jgi:hypothetical protein
MLMRIVLRRQARVHLGQAVEALDHEAGAYQQDNGKRGLDHD